MPRSVKPWSGRTDDTPAPPRVRLRVFEREQGRCHSCARLIRAGEKWTLEHRVALVNSGRNAEDNLCLTCCNCLPDKNAADVAEKSSIYAKRKKHILPKASKRPWPSRPMRQDWKPNVRQLRDD